MTASICSNKASIGVKCLLKGVDEDADVEGGEGLEDEYSIILLSPECFSDLPFSLHIAAIFLNLSLVQTFSLVMPNLGVSGEAADVNPF